MEAIEMKVRIFHDDKGRINIEKEINEWLAESHAEVIHVAQSGSFIPGANEVQTSISVWYTVLGKDIA
jgi:hypothetical protein